MKTIRYSDFYKSRPLWMADAPEYLNYVPGGARLRAESIPGVDKNLPGGSLVGRTATNRDFEFIPPTATKSSGNFTTTNQSVLAAPAAQGSNVVKVQNTDGYKVGSSITIAGTAYTITAVGIDNSLTLNTALAAARVAGTPVALTSAVPYVELYLTATEIIDVTVNCEFTQYRHERMVYLNFLPGFASFSADVLATVKELYHYIAAAA